MNDFSELEKDLKKLRPAQASPVLLERVGEALKDSRATVSGASSKRWRFTETPYSNWWSLGFGLAAAAVLILFAAVTMERRHEPQQTAALSSPAPETPAPLGTQRSTSPSRFVPAGGTNLVYNTRDEGLHFANGSQRPVRRVRYSTKQTWRWRNPETGASLRVSYPSEEIVLIPVSGQ
jgi:hypothetical protein